jgi:hypothetical protein
MLKLKVTQNNIPTFNFVTNMGHKCFLTISIYKAKQFILKKIIFKDLNIILEDNGSEYASGDIAQLFVPQKI